MTPEEAVALLKTLQAGDDPERDHRVADDILCDLLTTLGHEDVVREYLKVDKWYA